VVQVAVIAAVGAGCSLSNGLDEYVVHFAPGTQPGPARAVGNACPRFGKAVLEPPAHGDLATNRAYPVRYDITNASSDDKAALTACLQKFPIVRGVSDTNDDDS
jgi:hypothetical protein